MFKLFEIKKTKTDKIVSPVSGTVKTLSEVPDPVFSTKMMGDGIAIYPTEGEVVSPVDGVVEHTFPSNHAIIIKSNNGTELLIHIGIDTVNLNGEGFVLNVETGQEVKMGDSLISFDLPFVEERVPSIIVPIIILNGETVKEMTVLDPPEVEKGKDGLLELVLKK